MFWYSIKILSLYGVVNINSKNDILKTYSDLINSWKEQNISFKVGYDRDSFLVTNIQENIDLVKTKLTNFDLDGNLLQEWNCTYIIRENNGQWLISLGTTDNKKTKWKEWRKTTPYFGKYGVVLENSSISGGIHINL